MDLVYLMLNDKGQTEPVQLLNSNGVPQLLDASDPLVSRLNTGPGSGRPMQVCNEDGEIVEAMQLTEFHYFVDENNKVIPIPPGSIVQGEFEDEDVEDSVSMGVHDTADIDIHFTTEAVNDASKKTEMVLVENIKQHPENFNVTFSDQELEQLKVSSSFDLNASDIVGSEDSQHNIQIDLGLSETSEFAQSTSETIFTQDEIELEEEVVSLQISEPVVAAHRPSVKLSKKANSSTGHHDSASSATKDAHKGSDAILPVDQQGRSPVKKSKKKQVSVVLGDEQAGQIDKVALQQCVKNANPTVEASSVPSDFSFSETGRPRRSVPRRSALEMLHGEGKTTSRKHATSSGSDSELDVGSGLLASCRRRNPKAIEKLEKSATMDIPVKSTVLSHSAGEFPPFATNEITEPEQNSELNSSAHVDMPSLIPSAKRGKKGRPKKMTSLLPPKPSESSDVIDNKIAVSSSCTLVNEPCDVNQQVSSIASPSNNLQSVDETNFAPVEQCFPFSINELPIAEENLKQSAVSSVGEVSEVIEGNQSSFSDELCTDATADAFNQNQVETMKALLKDISDEGTSNVSEFKSSVTEAADQISVGVTLGKKHLKIENEVDIGLTSDHQPGAIHVDKSELGASLELATVTSIEPENCKETRNLDIYVGTNNTSENLPEIEPKGSFLSACEGEIESLMKIESQHGSISVCQPKSISVEKCSVSLRDIAAKVSSDYKHFTMPVQKNSVNDSSVKDGVASAGNSMATIQLQEGREEETDDRCHKLADLKLSPLCEAKQAEIRHDVDSSHVCEVCPFGVNEAGAMNFTTAKDDEVVNADFLDLHGHDEEDIYSLVKGAYPEQEDVRFCEDVDMEMQHNPEQMNDKTEACGESSVYLLNVLRNAQKTITTIEEDPVGLDNKTALLILAEIEKLASEIRSKLVQREPEEDTQASTAGQTTNKWKHANEKRFQRIVTNELMKLRALDEEVDQRYSQLMIARGELSRKESQIRQQQLALERNQMLLELEKEHFEEEQKKLRREKDRKLHSELKQSRKRLAESSPVQTKSSKRARISNTDQALLGVVKQRRPLFEEMTAIKETKTISMSTKSPLPFKKSNTSISHSDSVSSSAVSSLICSEGTPTTKLHEGKLCREEVFDRPVLASPDSSPKASNEKDIPALPSGASVVVKGKKELLRRFEADELNSPSEDLATDKLTQKPVKPSEAASISSSSTVKKAGKHSRGPTAAPASSKHSSERSMPVTSYKSGSLVKKSYSESKSHSKDSLSTVSGKKHSSDVRTSVHKDKTDSRNLGRPSFSSSKKEENKVHKRSV